MLIIFIHFNKLIFKIANFFMNQNKLSKNYKISDRDDIDSPQYIPNLFSHIISKVEPLRKIGIIILLLL